jgi:hypothetical protein
MVDYSHEVISEQLGDNWRDEYVVWDPAAGTLNLTRDYQFKELYCSTLFQEELDLASDYNPEAIKFQFDFLNDEFKPIKSGGKVPDNLYSAILDEKKKVMILMNPPYGTAASGIGVSSKGGAASSNPINAIMQDNNFAQAAQDLYTIFIFNSIIILTQEGKINLNRTISQFTKTGFLSTGGMINFSQYMKERFTMKKGFAFDSKYFEGAAGGWPVIFSIWESAKIPGETGKEVIVDFVKLSDENKVEQETKKKFYIIEKNENATEWVKEKNKGKILDKNQITLSMPCTVKPLEGKNGKVFKNNSIGYFLCNSNTLKKAPTDTAIFSYSYSSGHGSAIDSDNIFRVTTLFVARKTPLTIYNYNDEFSKPNEENSKFEEFKNNSVVYSLFNTSSYQSSLRKIGYDSTGNPISYPTSVNKGNINVYNEWFFLSHKEITELADEHFSELYQDTKGQKDRHIQLDLDSGQQAFPGGPGGPRGRQEAGQGHLPYQGEDPRPVPGVPPERVGRGLLADQDRARKSRNGELPGRHEGQVQATGRQDEAPGLRVGVPQESAVSPEQKRSRVSELLESLKSEEISEFMSWANPRLTWYAGANIQHSETQLDEMIARLEEITKRE